MSTPNSSPGAVPRPVPDMRELEVLVDLMLGPDDGHHELPAPGPGGIQAALDSVLVPALERTPCVVSFSGGRDSSAVLALACDAARRHGLDLPVPVIMRFPQATGADEGEWQELVLGHLGLGEPEVVSLTNELDAVGPLAAAFLLRHGARWPGNTHMHAPILALARGGTILTGVGGDELFGTSSPRRRARAFLLGSLPGPVRARVHRARHPLDGYGWLTAAGRALVAAAVAREEVSWPYRWDRALRHWFASRAFAAMDGNLSLLADDSDVTVVNPLITPPVLAEVMRAGGARGFVARSDAMRWLAGSVLPPAVIERQTKAVFTGALVGDATREFLAGWDGAGVDPTYVDIRRLREGFQVAEPDVRAVLLVQKAWLAKRVRRTGVP